MLLKKDFVSMPSMNTRFQQFVSYGRESTDASVRLKGSLQEGNIKPTS